ncbi:MAG: thioredoxin family protein [Crocinitomicaceae bacterium]|nr:thioredoxin family protein [Crocinitomicaceae bacterium]
MKKGIIGTVILLLAVSSLAFVDSTELSEETEVVVNSEVAESELNEEIVGIEFFEGTWVEALEKAEEENKMIFLDAYATWCGPCKRMSKNVFTDQEVGALFNKNYINFKMDMEKGVGPQMARNLELHSYPTLYIMTSDGEPITSQVGFSDVASLLSLGESSLEGQ